LPSIRLYIFFIAISFLVSLSVYIRPKGVPAYLKFFPPFLLATLIVEITAVYITKYGKHNVTLYNFFTTFEFCFYMWILHMLVKNKRVRLILVSTIPIYAIAAVYNIIWKQGMDRFHTVTYSMGCLLIVIFSTYYFLELFRLPKSVKLANNPAFWICSGVLFFYCCGFPLYAFINFWIQFEWVVKSFNDIFNILNIFLYSLFTISFICVRTRKYTLSLS